MIIVAGLGNPGLQYTETRHNVGFMFLDYLASEANAHFRDSKWDADVVKTLLWQLPVLLVKPTTFMNLSGKAIGQIAAYYQVPPEKIIIIHDDLDLEPGRIKIFFDRGHGGHNGIRSIIESLGTKEFVRLKIGIGRPPEKMKPSAFVLSKFSGEELLSVREGFSFMAGAIRLIAEEGVIKAMNSVNKKKNS
ncbi:MAG: aminoacyl-tRNA hydrolase [Proteobacteria bacterium]|nr:aminoacyl-tRNA hydrolase [Pseudomonadota bacterium]MBU1739241.1 aminoacyl-tRNA hydrolase [Pseudomonadota bacterium]